MLHKQPFTKKFDVWIPFTIQISEMKLYYDTIEWIVQISFMRFVFYDFILDYSIGWKYEIHVASR